MTKIRQISIIIPNTKKISELKKILTKFFSTYGTIQSCVLDSDKIEFNVKFNPKKIIESNYPNIELESTLYKSNFKIGMCNHGFLLIETSIKRNIPPNEREHLALILSQLEFKIKNIKGLWDKKQLITSDDLKIRPIDTGAFIADKTLPVTIDSYVKIVQNGIKRRLQELYVGWTSSPSLESKIDFVKTFFILEKIVQAFFYKLIFSEQKCTLLKTDKRSFDNLALNLFQICENMKTAVIGTINVKKY